jgi:transmembrane sensor
MTEELIERFFTKQCTAAESIRVSQYLKAHPELMDKYLNQDEWNNDETGFEMPEEFWDEMWADIQKKKRTKTVIIYLKKTAVAACIAILLVAGYFWYAETGTGDDIAQSHVLLQVKAEQIAEHKVLNNRSAKMMKIMLQDSSFINLSSGSMLRYDTPFQKNKREVWLQGEAYFKVAKNETKPFTVYAAGLATTALGTEFRITTNDKRNNIIVRLYKGKVFIQPATYSLKGWNKNIYLLPGEQMQYNTDKMLVAVGKIINDNNPSSKRAPINSAGKKNEAIANQSLSFNSTSLSEVLEKLAKYYGARIEFNKAEIKEMSFTGNITRNDSLPTVLKIVAQMNELEIIQQDDSFIVKTLDKK